MSTASDTLPPNATADQLPGNENDTDPSAKQPGHRAGTAKVAKAAQASSTAAVPPPPPSSNKQGTAPAPGSNTLTNILGHYASTARPSTARIDPNAAPNSSPIALTIGNLWRYIPLVASAATSIGTAIASHAIYGPPKKSWGVEMTIFTRIMRDCGTQSEFATIAGLQQFFDLGSLLPVPKDGLITPVTFRVKKRNLRGFLKDADEGEDGKRELTGEWVVTKSTWKRLQSEWRSKSGGTTAAGMDKSNSNTSVTNNAEPASSSGTAQRSSSVPAQSKRSKDSEAAAAAPSSAAPNGKPTSAAVNGTGTSTSTSPPQKSTSISSSSTSTSSSEPPPPTGAANGNANEKTTNGTANPSSSEFKRSDSVRGQPPRRERIIYYIHGGAYFVMSAATHRPLTISLSKYAECRVFAINYRLAPDTKFPGALHDCVSAWFRLVEDLGIPPKNIVLGADSAGGGLALALLCYLRDEKYELPAGAMLFSPWVDLTLSCDSWDTNSKYDYLPMPPSGSHMNPVHAYLGDDIEQYLTHPYVSPLFADMHGLPPLLIQCGDAEVLRDEGTLLAHKASLAGVSVRHELYEDCVHVFQAFLFLDASRKALQSARHFMRTALDRPPSSSSSKPGRSRSTKAKKVTGSGSGKDGRKMSASSSSGAAAATAAAADPRRKLLAEEAAAGTGEDTGTETEGDEGSKTADAAAAAARLDAATRDRMDAEMRSGMGNVRGQRVEPSTGERERRHHHHHHHQSGRKSGAVGRVGAEAGSTAKVDSGPVASSGEKEAKEAGPAEVSTSSGSSASDNDDDDDDGDEDEEFAYARTRKGSGAEKLSSAAAAFKAMQQRQQLRRTPSSTTTTTTNSSSLSNSTVVPPASSSSNSTTGVPSSGGVATAASAAEGGAENDAELLAAFHPPKSVLTPRMRQSSLVGLASSSEEAAAPGSAADGSVSGSAGLMTDGGADASLSSSSASSVAAGGGEKDSPSSSTSPADASSISKSSASGSSIRPSFQLSKRNRSSAAISSLMESYAANPGVLRTNVWTPSGEGAGGSGNGAGAE
ncbi:hypothetical protein CF319_g3874 [Tilletia indica]|nr:hypothetical protein CF319_g3874 [Tilletia indica]